MPIQDEIRDAVDEIAAERGLVDNRAFGYWFLENLEDISPVEAATLVTDGAWDEGRDAVRFIDDEGRTSSARRSGTSTPPASSQTR